MTKISDLPRDVIGEILSRVPLTSLRAVRSTCKTWNDTSKIQVLGQKAAGARKKSQFLEFMVVDRCLCSLRFDLRGVRNDDYELAGPSITKIKVDISIVDQCNGLLLCYLKDDHTKILVWNPYLGQSRLIQTGEKYFTLYALGYDENRNHKILKICDADCQFFEVYDFSSDSWRFLDISFDHDYEPFFRTVLSLKGNTYFPGRNYLVCFDFTTERFGRCMPLPYTYHPDYALDQFWVRDEKVAVAVEYYTSRKLQIWITTKLEPNEVSWSSFLRLDVSLINGLPYNFLIYPRTFFIDEEKKVVILIDRRMLVPGQREILAHIIGEDGYLKSFNIIRNSGPNRWDLAEFVYCSYVPSLAQVQIN